MTQPHPPGGIARLHAAMAARVARRELPGVITLVATDERVDVDVIGVTAFDGSAPMRQDTLFRIASMTKPIAAAATMQLVESGVLALDAPIDRWLPQLANRRVLRRIDAPLDDTVPAHRPITVDDLLTNRMGFGIVTEPTFNPAFPVVDASKTGDLALYEPDPRTPYAPDEWIKRFADLPLMYQPGERWQYNVASLVLGVLVARAAGQPLGDVFQKRVFEPLGMHHTGFSQPIELTRSLPSYYLTNVETGQLELRNVSTPEEWSRPQTFPSAAGGLVSTLDDFLRFGRMLLNGGEFEGGRLLSSGSVERMTTNQLTAEQRATGGVILGGRGWGFGMGVEVDPDADWPVPGRYGWSGGYGTAWFNDPHRRIIALALSQVSDFLWNGGLVEFDQLVGRT